ncbi:hypothetical protein GC176_24000 [bacterium]|nr:hypothetical protein [bacterium]
MHSLIGKLLGRNDVDAIDGVRLSFGAEWAHTGPAWLLFGCLALGFLGALFYLKFQPRTSPRVRITLGFVRGALLCLLLLILADPILEVAFSSHPRPVLWVLLDGTQSMTIADRLTAEETQQFRKTLGAEAAADSPSAQSSAESVSPDGVSRASLVQQWLRHSGADVSNELAGKFQFAFFQFRDADEVSELAVSDSDAADAKFDGEKLAEQYQPDGSVTSISSALDDLRRRHISTNLAGVVLVSDFGHNSGAAPLEAARRVGVPIHTVGVGAKQAVDLGVDLQTPLTMKKAETSTVIASVRQQELMGTSATVRVFAKPVEVGTDRISERSIPIGERTVELPGPSTIVEFPFTPEEAGRFAFVAEVEPVDGEIVEQNNRAEREVTVIDDFLRLMFVEYEPTWEWRFVKEVFHRDKLVGLRGFRTYLRSSDPTVRESNDLFLPTLTLPRNEFFEYDVIFLGDMPVSSLSSRFGEMVKEFVGKFGGGLVVMAGPRFGPGQLAGTPIADMLPVVVDPDEPIRDDREFELQLSPFASQYDFMRLGDTDAENAKAWSNLGSLPWYQPVRRVETSATTVLAEHPTAVCSDGRTPQPLIAIRRYGRGEVVYIGQNEMWRLRRKYGEAYYRQFWGQLIHRLGLSHALGSHKRFVVRTDRQRYQPDETAIVTVEAYDENFEPLTGDVLDDRHLSGELWLPERTDGSLEATRPITLTEFRPGVFETRIPVSESGDYVARVTDPITLEPVDAYFQVTDLSVERRTATRNVALQEAIAAETGGRTADLTTVRDLLTSLDAPRLTETTVEVLPLWSTWLCFALLVTLMLSEWTIRKLSNLA